MMFHGLNSSANTIGVDDKSPDKLNTSIFHLNQSYNIEESTPSPSHSNQVVRLLQVFINPILIVFGTYGNAVSFYIMRRGSLKEVSMCFYMAMLAIADTREYFITLLEGYV